jgi:hypothetical protein
VGEVVTESEMVALQKIMSLQEDISYFKGRNAELEKQAKKDKEIIDKLLEKIK